MSTHSMYGTDTVPANPALAGARVTFARVLRSEWRKLFSLRSASILLVCGAAVMLLFSGGLSLIMGLQMDSVEVDVPWAMVAQMGGLGLQIGGLLVAANAVVNLAGEYTTHTAVSTYSAVPRRGLVYLAKILINGAIGFVFGAVCHGLAMLVTGLVFAATGHGVVSDGRLVTEALISGLYVFLLVCMGLGLGALMRNTTGAVVTVAVFVYVISNVLVGLSFMGNKVVGWFANHLPTAAVDALRPSNNALSGATDADIAAAGMTPVEQLAAWDIWLTIGFWAIVPLALGYLATVRRPVR
ncbi:MAG: hypothetical protein LBE25_09175 [Arthrobacter sp.]|jgi:ABC-2 type transport system permease protein|nr:hypothetical protein [Arthrobacter sp.]